MKPSKKILSLISASLCYFSAFSEPYLTKIKTVSCGKQPKQVVFSYDGKYIVLPLLDEKGFEIISSNGEQKKFFAPPNTNQKGFAEALFIPQKQTLFVSQMTINQIHEYKYNAQLPFEKAFTYKRSLPTKGDWSKYIVYSKEKNIIAVSNWISNNVSIIDYDSGKVLKLIATGRAPRGLCFLNNGKELLVQCFEGGQIQKFEVESGNKIDEIKIQNSAMRHVTVNKAGDTAFISDMYHHTVYKLNLLDFKIKATYKVFNNPNTICLMNDRYLFVSCRGPNNPEDYTKPSPVNGKIYVIDTETEKTIQIIEGGNQPTGLDISPDRKILCFSNFQDKTIELWNIANK